MTLAAGTRVGSYEVIGSLGAGGMGEVYRARDVKLGRAAALKVLPHVIGVFAARQAGVNLPSQIVVVVNWFQEIRSRLGS